MRALLLLCATAAALFSADVKSGETVQAELPPYGGFVMEINPVR